MQNHKEYISRFEARYELKIHNHIEGQRPVNLFLAGFLSFFGIANNTYKKAIEKIRGLTEEEALNSDAGQLRQDFYRVFERYRHTLPASSPHNT